MSRRGRRIADVDSPIATVKTLFGSDGALAGGGDGDSSGTFVYYILSCTFILKAFLIYSNIFFSFLRHLQTMKGHLFHL